MATKKSRATRIAVVAQAGAKYDYDLVIIGCGVGGHGAALHAVEQVRCRAAGLVSQLAVAVTWEFFSSVKHSSGSSSGGTTPLCHHQ